MTERLRTHRSGEEDEPEFTDSIAWGEFDDIG
jgi:hypothetical protein